jgi:hypothetical protein
MKAIRDFEAGKTKFEPAKVLDFGGRSSTTP